jgi:hypothetical protein
MIIGFDFDNTIVCYDNAIAILAEQQFDLPPDLPRTKLGIRDFLRARGREEEWTRFQGELYGPGMAHAEPFEYAVDVIRELAGLGHRLSVISHRTRFPYLGLRYDLHGFAASWLGERIPAAFESVTFHERKAEKIATIARTGCELFLDDLPEILSDSAFPRSTTGVLFSPNVETSTWRGARVSSWRDLAIVVKSGVDIRG